MAQWLCGSGPMGALDLIFMSIRTTLALPASRCHSYTCLSAPFSWFPGWQGLPLSIPQIWARSEGGSLRQWNVLQHLLTLNAHEAVDEDAAMGSCEHSVKSVMHHGWCTSTVGCGAGRNITAQWKSILTGCGEPKQTPPPGNNEKNEEPLQVMDGQTLCGIKSLLMERKWFFFFIIVIIVSRSPSDTGVIKDIVIISFNLSIHIHHEIGGGWEGVRGGAGNMCMKPNMQEHHCLSVFFLSAPLPNAFSVKLLWYQSVMRQIRGAIKLRQ